MIDDHMQARMALSHFAELRHGIRCERHHRNVVAFSGVPKPVGSAVLEPFLGAACVKNQSDAQHMWLVFPACDQRAAFRGGEFDSSHDGKTIWMQTGSFKRSIVAVAFPSRRHKHAALDTGAVHFAQKLIMTERDGTMRRRGIFFRVGLFRRLRRPNVNLRIDD